MLKNNPVRRAFTLVELLVTLAVSSIIIGATFASYQMVANQYNKNMDIADMHTSGRAIIQIIERDVRMAGFVFLDASAVNTYGTIAKPLVITDSGNKCCDKVVLIYDSINAETSKVERLRITYSTATHTGTKGARNRLYKQIDILGKDNVVLATPTLGTKDVMADFVEDFQIVNAGPLPPTSGGSGYIKIDDTGKELPKSSIKWSCVKDKKTNLIWEAKSKESGLHYYKDYYTWYDSDSSTNGGNAGLKKNWFKPKQVLQNTEDFIAAVNSENLCNSSSWAMPTIDELRSIVDKSKRPAVNTDFIPDRTSTEYWTSSEDPDYLKKHGLPLGRKGEWVWAVNLTSGDEHNGFHKSNVEYVILVTKPYAELKIVNINLILRTKNPYGGDRNFKKKDYHKGDYKLDVTDKYKRDTFSSTVFARNMVL